MDDRLAPYNVPGEVSLHEARDWLANAEAVLIGAGAGLSAAAGFDYGDQERFARLYPAFLQYGFRAEYEFIGADLPQDLLWGYWAPHVLDVRFGPRPHPIYQRLRAMVGERPHFVLTSNVDALFARNGFDAAHIYTPQGDYAFYQCTTPCTHEVWPSQHLMEELAAATDPQTGRVTDASLLPVCPNCGEHVFLNVRGDASFIHDHFAAQGEAANVWLNGHADERLVLLDIGSGFNTPSVVRWPMERLAVSLPNARLIRINLQYPGVQADATSVTCSLGMQVGAAFDALGC